MTNKELLIDILLKAKADYKTSVDAPRGIFSFSKKTYKRLHTDQGLCHYFQEAHNVCNLVDKHLIDFKPDRNTVGYWFPVGHDGLNLRLQILEKALSFYREVNDFDVPLILHNTYLENTSIYNAVENGTRVTPEGQHIYFYFMENYDDLLERLESDK